MKQAGSCEALRKPLADGSTAMALINRGSSGSDFSLKSGQIGLLDGRKFVRNLWAQADVADFTVELTQRLQPHETLLLKITT